MTNTCPCTRPTRDNTHACDTCLNELANALADVPWLADELETSITRQKGIDYRTLGGSKGGKKDAERPSPVSWGPAEARTNLHAILAAWARYCHDENVRNSSPYPGLPDNNPTAISRWLLWRIDGLAHHDTAPDAITQITDAINHCHRTIDRPADSKFYGRCPCGEWLYTRPGAPTITCPNCGTHNDTNQLNADMWEQAMDQFVTPTQARALANRMGLEIPESTMYRWITRWVNDGRLIEHQLTGERVFSFRDLSALIQAATAKEEQTA